MQIQQREEQTLGGWFMRYHCGRGRLRLQVFTAAGTYPVGGARIRVTRTMGGRTQVFYEGTTDISGIVQGILLPALPEEGSNDPLTAGHSGTVYLVTVLHPKFRTVTARPAAVYDTVETILPVELQPMPEKGES